MAGYIERESLIKDFQSCGASSDLIDAIVYRIKLHKIADVEPVKHGRWLTWEEMFPGKTPKRKNNLGVFCDQCRNHADNMSDYCPNCGAKMDLEVYE